MSEEIDNETLKTLKPKLRDDVTTWVFFKGRKKEEAIYIIGSIEVDRYITVPVSKMNIITKALTFFDGEKSIKEIEDHFYNHQRKKLDVASLYKKVAENGLVEGVDQKDIKKGGIERFSVKLFDISATRLFDALEPFANFISSGFIIFSLLIIAIGTTITIKDYHLFTELLASRGSLYHSLLYFGLIFLSFAFHEIAHAIAALRYKLKPKKFEVSLYLGFIPMFFLRIPGLYTISPKQRLVVWSAGIFWNFLFASLCALCIKFLDLPPAVTHVLHSVVLANYTIGIFNLFPFLPTDGYFLISTMLRKYNMRAHAWREFFKMVTTRDYRVSIPLILYFLGSVTIIIVLLFNNLRLIGVSLSDNLFTGLLRLSLSIAFFSIFFARLIREIQNYSSKRNSKKAT